MEKVPLQAQVLKMGQNFTNIDSAPELRRHKNSLAGNF